MVLEAQAKLPARNASQDSNGLRTNLNWSAETALLVILIKISRIHSTVTRVLVVCYFQRHEIATNLCLHCVGYFFFLMQAVIKM